ncbi:MAG TPA: hypothetical protein PLG22_07355 [Kiritimatiellia bacterium]|nr:hypothetical protein [Kiritimatiellia bacterium]
MNGADQLGNLVQGIQALVTLAVGVCTIVALTRKQPPIDQILREEISKLYDENKLDRRSTEKELRDHEGRIAKLEGTCQSLNGNGKSCARQ